MVNGVPRSRLALIEAVLAKHAGLRMHSCNLHLNVPGGLMLREPGTDLGIAVAVAAAMRDSTMPSDMAVVGEIGA